MKRDAKVPEEFQRSSMPLRPSPLTADSMASSFGLPRRGLRVRADGRMALWMSYGRMCGLVLAVLFAALCCMPRPTGMNCFPGRGAA